MHPMSDDVQNGHTALHLSSLNGHTATVAALQGRGADTNIITHDEVCICLPL